MVAPRRRRPIQQPGRARSDRLPELRAVYRAGGGLCGNGAGAAGHHDRDRAAAEYRAAGQASGVGRCTLGRQVDAWAGRRCARRGLPGGERRLERPWPAIFRAARDDPRHLGGGQNRPHAEGTRPTSARGWIEWRGAGSDGGVRRRSNKPGLHAVGGGGRAALHSAPRAKKPTPADEVLVAERNPPDATFGWGVVFSEETLGALRDADYETYSEIAESFARWNAIDIYYRDTKIRSRGHAFTGISRKVLLNILQRRCQALGVRIDFEREVRDINEFAGADLIIGADGINGLVRRTHAELFKPQIAIHPTKYVWFGSDLPLDAFTFIFRRNDHGLFQVHAYPFDARTCTFIVECPEDAWRRAGLASASEADSIAYCQDLFQPELRGRRLMSNRSLWLSFTTLRQESWHRGSVVVLGDAAHTAHFSIGSGTKLAMEDSIALGDALRRHHDLDAALNDYEMERQPVGERFQEAALASSSYFQHVSRYAGFDPRQFAFNLLTRSRRITYVNLTQRDPELVRTVDSWFSAAATGSPDGAMRLSPPPMFAPFRIGEFALPNRVAIAAGHDLDAAARAGAALVLTEFVSVTEDGRITLQTPVIDRSYQEVLRTAAERIHQSGSQVGLQLGHAGRRGSMRPRSDGVNRPLLRPA